MRRCIDTVPVAQRKLVTSHDALGYFARRYGIDVVGTVIPARTTAGQPSAGEVARLVATIRASGVKAIFAESAVNPKVERAIAGEAGAKVGRELWADSLGPDGSDGASYIGSIEANTRALVEGFTRTSGGGAASMPDLSAPYIQRGIVEMLLLAVIAGVLGTWVVLRRLPFFTHAIGTATFPGLVVAGPWGVPAQLTALVCAVGFGGALERLQRTRRIDSDAAIGLLLVAALAIGVVLASDVYHSDASVDRLLFGSLIALTPLDLWLTAAAARRRAGVRPRAAPRLAGHRLRRHRRPRRRRARRRSPTARC